MANHASHAALPYPIKGARFTLKIPYLDADGDPTDPTTPDTEISKDDGAAADTAEEVASPKNSVGMLTLSGAETDCSCAGIAAKAASGPKTTLATLYPRVLAVVGTGTLSAGSAGGGTLGTLLPYDVTGCFIKTTGGTGGGGTGGANNQARKIITYNTSSGVFTVEPNWETTPSTDTTYAVLLPEGVTLGMLQALNPATAGRKLVVDSAGLGDANMVKSGPTGSGTPQTAGDIFGALGALNTAAASGDPGTTTTLVGYLKQLVNVLVGSAGVATYPAGAAPANGVSLAEVMAHVKDLLDAVGTLSQSAVDNTGTLLTRLSAARAGYLDFLNVGGAVASQADITALNQSASRRIILTTVGQYERPESGSTVYTVEARTFDGDGAAVNADSNPTLTGTGQTSGSLAANISAITNPATGVYRWTYTVASGATIEPARFDVSATIGGGTFTLSVYTQVVDFVAATWTTTDQSNLTTIFNKLPSKTYLAGTNNSDGDIQINEATGTPADPAGVTTLLTRVGSPSVSIAADLNTVYTNLLSAIQTVDGIVQGVQTDTGTLVTRFTSARADYLDNLSAGAVALNADMATLLTRIPGVVQPQSGDAFLRLATYRLDQIFTADVTAPVAGSMFGDLTEDNSGTRRLTAAALINSPTGSGGTTNNVNEEMTIITTGGNGS